MAVEISYVLITPHSLLKSRTGGIVARLMSQADLEFVGAQILRFNADMTERYAKCVEEDIVEDSPVNAKLLSDYVRANFGPREDGRMERTMLLLFRGEDACAKLTALTGRLKRMDATFGETLRDTYGDYVEDKNDPNHVIYFEPAVLTPPNAEVAKSKLSILAEVAASQPNLPENVNNVDRTLVIIKPENWSDRSSRPGNIMDMLSRTALRIVGCKLYRMSVEDALEFYGPVRGALRAKLAPKIGARAKEMMEREFKVKFDENALNALTQIVGLPFAEDQFSQIIEFMSGRRPEDCAPEEMACQNQTKCLVLIYEGANAIAKIRKVLGPTDPAKAPGGTVRRDFGSDVMINSAHASDSPENVLREMGIVQIQRNSVVDKIKEFYA